MSTQNKTRRQKLEEFLAQNPTDAFTLYGIALEFLRERDLVAAEKYFKELLQTNPEYVPGYQIYAQTLAEHDRAEEAKDLLNKGIAAASRQGNQHARSEMEGLLEQLG
jgi:predicted Zn-dependent protease